MTPLSLGFDILSIRLETHVTSVESTIVSPLGSPASDRVHHFSLRLVGIRRRDHSWHLSVAVLLLLLGDIVALEVWLQLQRYFDSSQVCLRFDCRAFPFLIVVPTGYLGVERLDRYPASITLYLLTGQLLQLVKRATV